MNTTTWKRSFDAQTSASPAALWSLMSDVAGWKKWNAGIEDVTLHGTFAEGTEFTMKSPGQDAFRSRLVAVRENECFIDETRIEDLVVTVAHRICTRETGLGVSYDIEVNGPGAAEIGPMIASDFPEVIAALIREAEANG